MPFSVRYQPVTVDPQGTVRPGGQGARMRDLDQPAPAGYQSSTGGSLMDLIRAKADGIYDGSYTDFHAGKSVFERKR